MAPYDGADYDYDPCPADGFCYKDYDNFEAGPICCSPEVLRSAGVADHCDVEMDFPGCYFYDYNWGEWTYQPAGEGNECAEQSKCFINT